MTNPWEQLYSDSKELTVATSLHEVFSKEDIAYIESRMKSIFTKFLQRGELHKGIKIYIDRKLSNNFVQKMAERLPVEEESLEEWCSSLFGDQKFGIVFNSLESFDNHLTERMCSIVHPLLQKAGMPIGGLSFLFFMGNYGFTPFGIHKEAKGEEGFLFHMGPSQKTFYTWNIEKLNAIEHNTEVFHNVEEMLPQAKSYELHPKSVMFVPNYLYHIANTDEFSFSVVMDYINPSRESLEEMIIQQIASKENDGASNNDYLAPISFSDKLDWSSTFDKTSWENKYKHAIQRYIYRLQSNHGVLLPSIPEIGNYIVDDQFSIQNKSTFQLISYEDEYGQLYVMARGNEIPVKKNENLMKVIEQLNQGQSFSFDQLKELLINEDWDLSNLYEFVSDLLEFAAVEKSN